jgi:hypothetical protein
MQMRTAECEDDIGVPNAPGPRRSRLLAPQPQPAAHTLRLRVRCLVARATTFSSTGRPWGPNAETGDGVRKC